MDSWKCNRRKQQEHIIERVVEVKKLELEEHDRNRKRTKTFSEMMEERFVIIYAFSFVRFIRCLGIRFSGNANFLMKSLLLQRFFYFSELRKDGN